MEERSWRAMRTRAVSPAHASADPEAGRAAEALRRAGGALPIDRLCEEVAPLAGGVEPVARCVRRRSDLFLLVEPPPAPWTDDWTPAEQRDYAPNPQRRRESVLLLDGSAAPGGPAPAVLRESLLTIWSDSPGDDELRRELSRAVESPATG